MDDRTYMIMGEDENGDVHLFATDNLDRARSALKDMKNRMANVRGNWAAEDFVRERQGKAQ